MVEVGFPDKDVEVFGVSFDPRIAPKRIRAADQDVEPVVCERCQRLAIEVSLLGIEGAPGIVGK